MDGIHPGLCAVLNGGGVCCRSVSVRWCAVVCALACLSVWRVSTAVVVCVVLLPWCVWCVVCVCVWCLCGGVSAMCPPPRPLLCSPLLWWWVGVVVGGIVMGGWLCDWCPRVLLVSPSVVLVGGLVLKGGVCDAVPPVVVLTLPFVCWCFPLLFILWSY